MLEAIRRFTGTWLAKVLFVVLAASFGVFFSMGDIARQIGIKNHVAAVGGEKIGIKEFQRALYQASERMNHLMGKRLSAEELKSLGLDKKVLRDLIHHTLIDLEARKMNLVISDDRVREEIYKQKWFKNKDGLFDRGMFLRFIQSQGYTEKDFADSIRRDIAKRLLFSAIIDGIRVAPTFVDAVYDYQFRPREVKVVKIPFSSIAVPAHTDQALESFYAQHKEEFVKPEYRKIVYYILPKDKLDKSREIEDHLASGKRLKEIHTEFALAQKTTAFITKDGISQDEKKVNELPDDPAFLEIAFTTQHQEDSMLFELLNGDWCAVHIEEILPSRIPAFEEIKANVVTRANFDQQKQRAGQIALETVEKLKDQGENFENFAKKQKQEIVTYKNITRVPEEGKKVPFSEAILSKIFNIKYASFGFVLADDHALVVSVPRPLPTDDVKKAKQLEVVSNDLDNSVGLDIVTAYLENLEKYYGVEIF